MEHYIRQRLTETVCTVTGLTGAILEHIVLPYLWCVEEMQCERKIRTILELENCHDRHMGYFLFRGQSFPTTCRENAWYEWNEAAMDELRFMHFFWRIYHWRPEPTLPRSWRHELQRRQWPDVDAPLTCPGTYHDATAQPELFWNLDTESWDAEDDRKWFEREPPNYRKPSPFTFQYIVRNSLGKPLPCAAYRRFTRKRIKTFG